MILENNERKIIIGKNIPNVAPVAQPEVEDKRELIYNISRTINEGGYNAISQLMGFIISEDPAHVSNYNNARTLMNRIDRDELLEDMIKTYLELLEREYGDKESN